MLATFQILVVTAFVASLVYWVLPAHWVDDPRPEAQEMNDYWVTVMARMNDTSASLRAPRPEPAASPRWAELPGDGRETHIE